MEQAEQELMANEDKAKGYLQAMMHEQRRLKKEIKFFKELMRMKFKK